MKPRAVSARRRATQSGYILLVIFLMAASVALMLYSQLPRVAFESEREKEQLLIERGEQYIRAIQLYYKDNNRFPQSLDELERGNNKRYLRRRYVDPYTGKDDWRLIHSNGLQLTDSLVQKPPSEQSATASSSQQPQPEPVNQAVLARPSDVTLPGAVDFNAPLPGATPAPPAQAPPAPGQPTFTGQPGFGVPGAGLPQGIPLPGNLQTNAAVPAGFQPQFPGQQFPGQPPPAGVQPNPAVGNQGFQPQFPGQQFPGQPPPPGMQAQTTAPPGFQIGPDGQLIPAPVGVATPIPGLPGANPAATPGVVAGTGSAGIDVINRLLTTPRAPPASASVPQNSAVGGGGIAGVASKHTGPSIKVYNDRQKYEEWEFVYTPAQGAGALGGLGGVGGPGAPGGRGGDGRGGLQPGGLNQGRAGASGGFPGAGAGLGQPGFGQTGRGPTGTAGVGPGGPGPSGPNPGRGGAGGVAPAGGVGRAK
jgi:type II secretory pathway pseudopilin PulG